MEWTDKAAHYCPTEEQAASNLGDRAIHELLKGSILAVLSKKLDDDGLQVDGDVVYGEPELVFNKELGMHGVQISATATLKPAEPKDEAEAVQ